jgi:hypothetical protein
MSDRPPCTVDPDTGLVTVRASAWSKPLCQLANSALGNRAKPPPDRLQAAFDAGHALEPQIEARMEAMGWKLSRSQEQVTLELIPGRFHLVGHIDDVATDTGSLGSRPVVVDAKSASPDMMAVWRREKGWVHGGAYAWQMSVYMMALGMPGVWVVCEKDPDNPHVLDWDREIVIEWCLEPLIGLGEMYEKAGELLALIDSGTVPECPTPPAYPCPWYYTHEVGEVELGDIDDDIEKWSQIYAKARDLERDAKKDKDTARDKLLEVLGDRDEARGMRWKVALKKTSRKGKLDEAAIAEELGVEDLEGFRGPASETTSIDVREI